MVEDVVAMPFDCVSNIGEGNVAVVVLLCTDGAMLIRDGNCERKSAISFFRRRFVYEMKFPSGELTNDPGRKKELVTHSQKIEEINEKQ